MISYITIPYDREIEHANMHAPSERDLEGRMCVTEGTPGLRRKYRSSLRTDI